MFSQTNKIIDSLYYVIKTTKNDTVIASSHYELGWFLKLKDLPAAKSHMDTALIMYKKLKSPGNVALCDFQYSVLHRLSGNYNEALASLTKFQDYVISVNDTVNFAFAYYEKGVVYSQKGDLEIALEQFIKSNALSEATNNQDMVGTTLNSIGITYNDLEKYDKAIESLNESLKAHKESGVEDESLGDVYLNLGNAYKYKEDLDTARANYKKALDYYEKFDSEFGIALINFNYGLIHNTANEFNEAIPFLNKAYKIQKENKFNAELVLTLSNLAESYSELGNLKKSKSYLEEGLSLESDNKASVRDLNLELYRLYEKEKKYKEALRFHKLYTKYKDSIFNETKIKNINDLDIKYQTEKKDKEISTQQLTLKEQELEIQKKKTQNNYMLGTVVFLLLLAVLLVFLFKQRQKRKNQEILTLKREVQIKTLESLIEGEEKERFRIAKELHDGVNGDLSAIKYKLSSLLEMNNTVIKEAITMIDDSCKQVRAISHNLVPPSLENFNVIEATQEYCLNMDEVQDVQINFQHIGEPILIAKKTEANMFRIIQELVTNSIKHAEASEINVQISHREHTIQLTIEDNGKGFDIEKAKGKGIGLSNVQSRLDYLQATMDVLSNKQGTSYTIEIDTEKLNDN